MQVDDFHQRSDADTVASTELSQGGVTGETEIMATDGPVRVSNLSTDDAVLALNPTTGRVTPKGVVEIQTIPNIDELVSIETRRSDFRIAPDHRIVYTTKGIPYPRFLRAGDVDERSELRFLNEWQPRSGEELAEVDITNLVDEYEIRASTTEHGHTFRAALPDGCEPSRRSREKGYYFDPETFKRFQSEIETIADGTAIHAGPNCRCLPYRFNGDDVIEFLAWFITEGCTCWRSEKDTAVVQIAQKDAETRPRIAALFERMGIDVAISDSAFSFSSTLYARLFEELCGSGSYNKRIPQFIWDVSQDQKQHFLNTLMSGDGNDYKTYYTASDQLASGILRLMLELGLKPRFTQREDCWQLYMSTINDGFKPPVNVNRIRNDEELYRLTIQDFSLVMAGRNGKFQWIGVSGVA